jgi:hypothetical protein
MIKIRNRFFFLLMAMVAGVLPATSQNYTITPGDTIMSNASFDDVSVYNFLPVNQGIDSLFFFWKKYSVNLPPTWEVSICDAGHCYSTIVDSSYMTAVVPGDAGLLSLHVNPHTESGIGIVQVIMNESHTPNTWDTLTWIISANGGTSVLSCSSNNEIQLFPNPVHHSLQVSLKEGGETQYEVQHADGRVLLHGLLYSSIDVSSIPVGSYWLHIKNKSTSGWIPFIKI